MVDICRQRTSAGAIQPEGTVDVDPLLVTILGENEVMEVVVGPCEAIEVGRIAKDTLSGSITAACGVEVDIPAPG
jgi:hypothetical protein